MDIEKFKSSFTDLLRPNRYKVIFHTPFAEFDEGLGFICKNTSFPFYTFNTIKTFFNNRDNFVINKVDYDPVSFTFMVDKNKKILSFVNKWKEQIIDENYLYGYKDDYKAEIEIILLHLNDEEIASCKLKNCILVNANPIDLSYETKDAISEITISIQYDDVEYKI